MSARLIGMAAFALALSASPSSAGGISNSKTAPDAKNVRGAAVAAVMPPLAERVDGLLRGRNLKPGVSMGLANDNGTVQLTVTELERGRLVRLINLTSRTMMGEWRLSTANASETEAAAAVVFQTMGLERPATLNNKATGGENKHAH